MRTKKTTRRPDNVYAEEIRILREAMLNKKLVVFVGAGTSLDAGVPSWSDAVKNIANKLGISEDKIDNLKIPQFYYNSRGKKEYVELMRKIFRFNDNLDVQEIHRNIVKMNVNTIITTNYDCLLEKAFAENSEFIQVISQDKELPYKTDGKELIKMHGDFEHDNFVLKEDDYLHYTDNFKLIEAYVKSLLATNVILFVGYSFNDPDIKQMFSWVKDILEDDLQRAYMLNVTQKFDLYELNYFKNLGVNVIYASEWVDRFDKKNASLYTKDFVKNILEGEKEEEQLEVLYRACQAYSELNYICKKDLNKVLMKCKLKLDGDKIILCDPQSQEAIKLLDDIFDNKNESRAMFIRSVISKSAAKRVVLPCIVKGKIKNNREILIDKNIDKKIASMIEMFDFEQLRKTRKKNEINLSETNPELYMKQAYISYIISEYGQAYRYLRIASQLFYKKKKYVWHFIAEINRKYIGKIATNTWGRECSQAEKDKIKQEIQGIEIEDLYRKIPTQELGDKEFLRDLYTFKRYFTLFQEIYILAQKTEEQANMRNSIYMGTAGYKELRENVWDCYEFDLQNYIMVDRYREDVEIYRLFASSILRSVCSGDYSSTIGMFETKNIHVRELEKFDIYVIIKYLRRKNLETILNENYKNYIEISDEARAYLHDICFNIEQIENCQSEYWNVYLTFIAYIKLDNSLVTNILKILERQTDETFIKLNCNRIIRFIYEAEQQGIIAEGETYTKYFEKLIENMLKIINKESMQQQAGKLLLWYLNTYKKIKEPYYSEALLKIVEMDNYIFLSKIYPICDVKIREKIEESCSKWKYESGKIKEYESLVLCDLIAKNAEIEEDIIKGLDKTKTESNGIQPSPYEGLISSLTVLYLNDKICMVDKVKDKIKKSGIEFYEWVVDADNYDYKNFDVSWLKIASDSLLKTIADSKNAKEKISKFIRHVYLNGNDDKDLLKIYFKYFIHENTDSNVL